MAIDRRIYKVKSANKVHLVRAFSQAQALRHIARHSFVIEVAKATEVADLIIAGVRLEEATGTDQVEMFGEELGQ